MQWWEPITPDTKGNRCYTRERSGLGPQQKDQYELKMAGKNPKSRLLPQRTEVGGRTIALRPNALREIVKGGGTVTTKREKGCCHKRRCEGGVRLKKKRREEGGERVGF